MNRSAPRRPSRQIGGTESAAKQPLLRRHAQRALVAALAFALLAASSANAACPCYTASSASNTYNCAIEAVPGTNPTVAEWQGVFATVAGGPPAWGSEGPAVASIGEGCSKPQPTTQVAAKFPCELLKAIAMRESGWRQFCPPDAPADQAGKSSRTIISFDCGYGIGQVTSGMRVGETPAFDRQRVAAEPLYNLATGASILAAKWRATNCVGDNQPKVVEHWYAAVWAYNGLSYSNNPNNPNYSSARGVWNPSVGGAAPYQEKVFGWMEHPAGGRWTALLPAYPPLSAIGNASAPPDLPEPDCASPTNCTVKRQVHLSSCFGGNPTDGGVPDGGLFDAGADARDAGSEDGGTPGDGETPDAGLPRFPEFVDSVSSEDSTVALPAAEGCHCSAVDPLLFVPWFAAVWLRRRHLP